MTSSQTSGTTSFTLDVDDIIEQALEPLGGQYESGVEASKARRVLNLLLIQLQNKGIPLSKLATQTLPLVSGTSIYTLDSSINDVLELNIQDLSQPNQIELPIERWGLEEFHKIPLKSTPQRPTVWTTERQNNGILLKFWPVPNQTYFQVTMLLALKIQDITASYQKVDLPYRFLPLLVKWLSYELALTRPNPSDPYKLTLQMLKASYTDCLPDTMEEDRERADMHLVPGGISGR